MSIYKLSNHPDVINNKYFRTYQSIIRKAQSEIYSNDEIHYKELSVLFEKHNILPCSMGGTNNSDNVILLSLKEYYIIHHLLIKFTKAKALINANRTFWNICNIEKYGEVGIKITAKVYTQIKANTLEDQKIYITKIFEQKAERLEKFQKTMATKEAKEKQSDGLKEWHANMTPEEKAEIKRKELETKESRTDEEKARTKEKQIVSLKKTFAKKTSKEKAKTAKKRKKTKAKNLAAKPVLTCPHCDKEGKDGNFKRWHFDNCKLKQGGPLEK